MAQTTTASLKILDDLKISRTFLRIYFNSNPNDF